MSATPPPISASINRSDPVPVRWRAMTRTAEEAVWFDEHRSCSDEVATNHRRQTHRHKYSHPRAAGTSPTTGLHTATEDDPQCDTRDQL